MNNNITTQAENDFICSYRVYYEDTDAAGVVYNANYLKFAERARTEMLRQHNISQSTLKQDLDVVFVVRNCSLELIKAAKFDDLITIKTRIKEVKGVRIIFFQELTVENQILSVITSSIVTVNTNFKPVKIPNFIKEKFLQLCA